MDDLGLEAAVESLCERASRHGIEIDRSLDLAYEQGREPTRHTAEFETAMYRIIQEALTNASKPGRARRAVIEILESETTVELSIRDDGDGFDPSISTAGFGLLGMRERVQLLDGEIEIESSPGNGTIVTASIPAQRRPAEAATPPVGERPLSAGIRRSTRSTNPGLAPSISATASARLTLPGVPGRWWQRTAAGARRRVARGRYILARGRGVRAVRL